MQRPLVSHLKIRQQSDKGVAPSVVNNSNDIARFLAILRILCLKIMMAQYDNIFASFLSLVVINPAL
ncbi:MAG TPA: hypothetical protein VJB08_03260, partial [Candidatus Nanoarchaeia archaeon]|nr:hypothetical protein [Candidatus Nanoarchaeia archaeon]